MPGLVKRTTRTTQPQTSVGIDWSNPITQGLEIVYSPSAYYNLAPNYTKTKIGSVLGLKKLYLNTEDIMQVPLTRNITLSEQFTFFCIASATSTSALAPPIFGLKSLTSTISLAYKIFNGTYGIDARNGANDTSSGISFPVNGKDIPCFSKYSSQQLVLGCNGQIFQIPKTLTTQTFNLLEVQYKQAGPDYPSPNSGLTVAIIYTRALSEAEIKSLSDNPWQIFQPDVSYLDQISEARATISPDESRWMGSQGRSTEISTGLFKYNTPRTQQPQALIPITNGRLSNRFNAFIDVIQRKMRVSSINKIQLLDKLSGGNNPYLDIEGGYYITHGNPGAAAAVPLNTSAKEITYHVSFMETGVSNGHFVGNAAPNYGVNKGASLLRGATLDAVMVGAGPVITQVTGPLRVLNVWKTLTLRIHNNDVNSTISIFDNGVLFASNTGAFVPSTQNIISLCGTMADYYPGTNFVNIRSVGVWDRALSDREIAYIAQNPWQIFQPHQKTLAYEQAVLKVDPPPATTKAVKLVKHVRTQQPTIPVKLDASNSIVRKMHWLYHASFDHFIEEIPGISTVESQGVHVGGTSSKGSIRKNMSTTSRYECSKPFGDELTFIAVIERNRETYSDTQGAKIAVYEAWNYPNNYATGLHLPSYSNGIRLSFEIRTSGGGSISLLDNITAGVGTVTQVVVGRFIKDKLFDLQINDTLYTGTAGPNGVDVNFYSKVRTTGMASTSNKGGTYFVGAIQRAISDTERASFIQNPWQIFQPESKTVWVDA